MKNNYLSIDIGGTKIKFAIIDHSGNIKKKLQIDTPNNLIDFLTRVENVIEKELDRIKGIAFSVPGKVDPLSGTVFFGGSLPYLNEISIKKIFETKYNVPVSIINDGKSAALAELWLGNLKGIKNGAAITLGTGLGGGIIINGELYQGQNFQAGELSFLSYSQNSFLKIEDLAGMKCSAVMMLNKVAKILNISENTDGKVIFENINTDNKEVYSVFAEYCREIAFVIINMQAIIDLQRVVIGGGISAQEVVIEEVRNQYLNLLQSLPIVNETLTEVEICSCKFKNESNLLGGLYQHFIQKEL